MTSEKQKNAGWLLPDQIDGYTEFVCYQVTVPNVVEYRSAFLGALQELAKWWNWEKTYAAGDTRASQAAAYWRELLAVLGDCEGTLFDIRQKPDAPCTIQKTFNNGGLWIDAVNMQLCPPRVRVNNGIVQWYNPATEAWEQTEAGDERTDGDAPAPWPDPPIGESGACLAAENIAATYQTGLTQVRAGVSLGQNVLAITTGLTGLMSVFIPTALVAVAAQAIALVALEAGVTALDTMLTHVDDLKCTVYCNIAEDGSVTTDSFNAIREGVAEWASGLELEIVQNWLDGFGSVGLTRQGRAAGITTGDCEDCDCEPEPIPWCVHIDLGDLTLYRVGAFPDNTGAEGFYNADDRAVFVAGMGAHKSPSRADRVSFWIQGSPSKPTWNITKVEAMLSNGALINTMLLTSVDGYQSPIGNMVITSDLTTYHGTTTFGTYIDVVMPSENDPYVLWLRYYGDDTTTNPFVLFNDPCS